MSGAGFAFVGATVGVFWSVQVAKVLKLVVFLHVTVDGWALPMGSFEIAMLGALLGDLDFTVGLS
jgi:hypothetical protein